MQLSVSTTKTPDVILVQNQHRWAHRLVRVDGSPNDADRSQFGARGLRPSRPSHATRYLFAREKGIKLRFVGNRILIFDVHIIHHSVTPVSEWARARICGSAFV